MFAFEKFDSGTDWKTQRDGAPACRAGPKWKRWAYDTVLLEVAAFDSRLEYLSCGSSSPLLAFSLNLGAAHDHE